MGGAMVRGRPSARDIAVGLPARDVVARACPTVSRAAARRDQFDREITRFCYGLADQTIGSSAPPAAFLPRTARLR